MASKQRDSTVRVDRSLVAVPRYKLEKIQRMERRRHMARDTGKSVLYLAGVGAVVALIANLDDLKQSKEAKDHWWLVPIAALVVGYMLKKRGHPYAAAVLAVGGALFALAYAGQSKQAQAQPAQQQVPPLPAPKQQALPGKKETGSPLGHAAPINMLPTPDGGLWVQAPDGQIVRISREQLAPVNQFAQRFMHSPAFRRAA
ncbi:hypothetical protein [Polyangium spumosum]|uniref:Uncharacterized protein n=1 Tax=Polyangium spumosum TaxID=889282 RepID=A0A6N7Q6Y1_9BACT|nr:hypothetical protein [Polyangium spumosum]MRG98475.1 hypothetical protein [Polyangium spumosum]